MKQDMTDDEIFRKVNKNINNLADNNVSWSVAFSEDTINDAKNGKFELYLTDNRPVPRKWFPDSLSGIKVLCLAGAGGQQAPYIAAAGADVTVLDLSESMLKKDEFVAKRDGLKLTVEHGNMCDLSRFSDGYFDMIVNPISLIYVPDIMIVFRECYRVLKENGIFIMGAVNPVDYLCDYIEDGGYYKVCNKLPYKSSDYAEQGEWIEYGHTLESLIGGQTKCGFAITGFYEDRSADPLGDYISSRFVTRAVKL